MADEAMAYGPEAPAPAAPAKKGLFAAKTPPPPPDTSGMTEQINAMAARVRIGEERYGELRKKMLLVEQNMLSNHKKAMTEIKTMQTDLMEVKRTIQAVEDRIITIIKEIRLTARKEDIDVMKRYLELWDPVKFVTHEQVDKIVDEKLGKHEEPEVKPNYDSPS
jgi:hypothetical protein